MNVLVDTSVWSLSLRRAKRVNDTASKELVELSREVTKEFAKDLGCRFWGRRTGYDMFGERGDGPHCDGVPLTADGVRLTPVDVGTIDFANRFEGDLAPDELLSLDAFNGKTITLDEAAATLTIETKAASRKERQP